MKNQWRCFAGWLGLGLCLQASLAGYSFADEFFRHSFERIQLTDEYYSEGANFGDINGDGVMDAVYGPFWFAGPEFQSSFPVYPAVPQPREAYADNFFNWVIDIDGDGRMDVLTVGFPGRPSYVYRNPGKNGWTQPWERHQVLDWVSNESPQFVNLVGDDRPELVCTRDGYFGYASINPTDPLAAWKFQPISEQVAASRFGHGLGVGDVNGDDRLDILTKDGWFEQPEQPAGRRWLFHPVPFAPRGGADMHAYDVDGDGDNDVITSLAAHEFGLAWWEQVSGGAEPEFRQHLIMGAKAAENRYGVVFSELHAVNLIDMDGDGLKDIVTGKTYWSHHRKSPMWDAGAVVYWFKLVRNEDGVDWIPFRADGEAGIGRQLTVGDVNGDHLPDVVVGGMKGAHVLLHRRESISREQWELEQPRLHVEIQAGLEPEQAARTMTVPGGFHVQLAAGEPTVHQPVAFTIDHRGRLWVAEAYTYPVRAPEGQGRDRIVILEDTTGDGTLDSRKVFIEGLNLISGIEVGFGGVWVGAAPYLMFIPDENADDRPDSRPRILLDGFGYQDTHEVLNAFNWGPDGWLYGCHGVFTHSLVGRPGTPEEERTGLNAGVWRYHPVRHEFEVFAWGTSNPWGVDFNDRGQAFITACVIPHLWHMIQGARYQRQGGRHFSPYIFEEIQTIAEHRHYVGNIRDHAWWGSEPNAPKSTLDAGGGHAHCGAMIYLADNWPRQYRNQMFMHNIHGNRINNDLLTRAGSGYRGSRGKDLLLANDRWFRGINLRYGPNGSVYIIDWYDRNACHRTEPDIWDRTNGRIYNIAYGSVDHVSVDLEALSDSKLVELHGHPNEWYTRMSRRILQHRAQSRATSPEAIAGLQAILAGSDSVSVRLRALWTLHAIDQLDGGQRLRLLDDADEYVRGWAIQLECEDGRMSPGFEAALQKRAESDPSPVVRLFIASALQRIDADIARSLLDRLVTHSDDADDQNLPLMYWYGAERLVASEADYGIDLVQRSRISTVSRFTVRRLATEAAGLDAVIALLAESEDEDQQEWVLAEIVRAYAGRVTVEMPDSWGAAYETLVKSQRATIRDQADQLAVIFGDRRLFPRMRALLAANDQPLEKRQQAMQILIRGRDSGAVDSFLTVLAEPRLRADALRGLAGFEDQRIATRLLAIYPQLRPQEKGDAINTLVGRRDSATRLLTAMADGKIPRTDLHAYHVRQMLGFNDSELATLIRSTWGEIRRSSADKQAEISRIKAGLSADVLKSADLSNGRRLFSRSCANCHRLFGDGGQIGPDITGSNRANVDYVLENVVDPSAVLGKDYRLTIIVTNSGRVLSGMIVDENEDAVTLRTINESTVIAKSEIDERQLSAQSMMPERLLDPFSPEEIRDLVAYLASPVQVPLRGPRAPIDSQTGLVNGAQEAESLPIVGKSDGQARSQAMGSFKSDRWSGDGQLWWTGAKPGSRLDLEVDVATSGRYRLETVLTRARDYGIVQLGLDKRKLGAAIDLFNNPGVITTGVLSFDDLELESGKHRFTIEITGANANAVKSYMVGIDYVRLVPLASRRETQK